MIRSTVLAALVLCPILARAAPVGEVTTGPLQGHTTSTTVRLWARLDRAGDFVAVVRDRGGEVVRRVTGASEPENDLCVTWDLEGLSPAASYDVSIESEDGSEVPKGRRTVETFPKSGARGVAKILFGSCGRTDAATKRTWDAMAKEEPDAVVVLGDTPYIDSTKVAVLRKKHRQYAGFAPMNDALRGAAYYSVWDDHDFGKNDVDGNLPGKESSRRVFHEYRPNASCGDDEGRGVYSKFRVGEVEVFLLDTRYFARTEPSPVDAKKPSLLGRSQWDWLLRELEGSTATFKVLASGMIWNDSTRPGKKDQWESYAHERDALFRFIGEKRIGGVVLMGGDVHRSRALIHSTSALAGYDILELITSPMHGGVIVAANAPHPALYHDAGEPSSFLSLEVDTRREEPRLVARAISAKGSRPRELFAMCVDARNHARSLRPRADLPPLLEFADGRPVRDVSEWPERREEIRQLLFEHFTGAPPEDIPKLLDAKVVSDRTADDGSLRRRVRLTFETPNRASFEIALWTPKREGPLPLLLTQPRAYQIDWAERALRRGYAVALYPGVDSHAREKDFPGYDSVWQSFRKEYPGATWTEIITKAWLSGRSLDYLLGDRCDVDFAAGQVAIIGFSRHGKQSMIAAALDERITSVVARSPGSPGSCPYRFTSRDTFAEAPSDFPSLWFLPSLRDYTGREHQLPMDSHGWYALIAPRRCLIHTALNDGSEPTFAVESGYIEGRSVYSLLGKPENLRIHWRAGQHGPVTDEQREQNIDWFDLSFGRGEIRPEQFPHEPHHDFDFEAWKIANEGRLESPFTSPEAKDGDRRERIEWLLDRAHSRRAVSPDEEPKFLTDAESKMMTHDRWSVGGVRRIPVRFGDGVRGNVYLPKESKAPATAVIWLHPYSYHSGYNEGYGVQGTTVYHRLAQRGVVVLAFDQCGFGLRLPEGRDFYRQYPHGSRLGRMVGDVHAAVDFLIDGKGSSKSGLPMIDAKRVFVLGFSVGGLVALHAAALDERIRGVASYSGFTPWRRDFAFEPTGGTRRLSRWHGLLPRLALFEGREAEIPYDLEDLLVLVAPRHCLLVTPKRDRNLDLRDVRVSVEKARPWIRQRGGRKTFESREPDDACRFQKDQQEEFLRWLDSIRLTR